LVDRRDCPRQANAVVGCGIPLTGRGFSRPVRVSCWQETWYPKLGEKFGPLGIENEKRQEAPQVALERFDEHFKSQTR
jgi:hypothetical protein